VRAPQALALVHLGKGQGEGFPPAPAGATSTFHTDPWLQPVSLRRRHGVPWASQFFWIFLDAPLPLEYGFRSEGVGRQLRTGGFSLMRVGCRSLLPWVAGPADLWRSRPGRFKQSVTSPRLTGSIVKDART
jgi:hypothetical protein